MDAAREQTACGSVKMAIGKCQMENTEVFLISSKTERNSQYYNQPSPALAPASCCLPPVSRRLAPVVGLQS